MFKKEPQKRSLFISKSGCDMYLSKPVSIDKFFKAVEKFIPSVTKKE